MVRDTGDIFLRLPTIKCVEDKPRHAFEILWKRFEAGDTDAYSQGVSPVEIKEIQRRIEKNGLQEHCRADVIAFVNIHAPKYKWGKMYSNTNTSQREIDFFTDDIETVIIEEASMVDTAVSSSKLRLSMVDAFPSIIRVVFVGDVNQLQSITNILNALIQSNAVPGATLAINHRSGALSKNIDCILEGNNEGIVIEPGKFGVVDVDDVDVVNKDGVYTRHASMPVVEEMSRISRETGHQLHSLCFMHIIEKLIV